MQSVSLEKYGWALLNDELEPIGSVDILGILLDGSCGQVLVATR